jgi:hypothetical protein
MCSRLNRFVRVYSLISDVWIKSSPFWEYKTHVQLSEELHRKDIAKFAFALH